MQWSILSFSLCSIFVRRHHNNIYIIIFKTTMECSHNGNIIQTELSFNKNKIRRKLIKMNFNKKKITIFEQIHCVRNVRTRVYAKIESCLRMRLWPWNSRKFDCITKKCCGQNNLNYLPVAPVNRVLISSPLLVRLVSHAAHEYSFMPLIWSKNMRPILLSSLPFFELFQSRNKLFSAIFRRFFFKFI